MTDRNPTRGFAPTTRDTAVRKMKSLRKNCFTEHRLSIKKPVVRAMTICSQAAQMSAAHSKRLSGFCCFRAEILAPEY
jgi:hypothetical protein